MRTPQPCAAWPGWRPGPLKLSAYLPRQRADDLAQIDRARSALLAAVGHDLRTPLAGIKVAVSSLRQSDTTLSLEAQAAPARHHRGLDRRAQRAGGQLAGPKPATGRRPERILTRSSSTPLSVPHCCTSDQDRHRSTSKCQMIFLWSVPMPVSGAGRGEPACQRPDSKPARPAGRGVSRGHCRSGELDHCRLRTRGAAELRDRIFEPFQRLHDRSTTGLGLGLAIARGFTEAMGGQIRPTDTPGGGLTMIISLPTADHPLTSDPESSKISDDPGPRRR